MDKYNKLLKNTGIFFIGSFGSKVLTFLLVRFYTEYLSAGEFGVVDIYNTTSSLLFPLVTLGITEAVLRFSIDDVDNRKKIFTLGLLVAILGNLAFVLTAPALCRIEVFREHLLWLYLLTITNSIVPLTAHFARGIGKAKLFALSGIIQAFSQIGLNIVFLAIFSWGITGYLIASVLANLVTFFYLFIWGKLLRYITWNWDFRYLKSMLIYSTPMIPNAVCWWIMQSSNRYMISCTLSVEANGLYAAASKVPTLISTISGIFLLAWQISSVEESQSKSKDNFYSKVFESWSAALIIATSVLMVLLQPVYRVLVDESFYSGWNVVPFLLCATVFSCYSAFLGTNYIAMKKTAGIFFTTMFGAFLNLALTWALLPIWGLIGAAVATMIAFIVTWVSRICGTRKFVNIRYSPMRFLFPLIFIIFQAVLLSCGISSILLQVFLLLAVIGLYALNGILKELFDFLFLCVFKSLKTR